MNVSGAPQTLSERDQALIDFERTWWVTDDAATKATAIRAALDVSPSTYYTALDQLIDSPAAEAYDPLVVRRLRRRRRERRRQRIDGYPSQRTHPR